jgi:hypothetical protein
MDEKKGRQLKPASFWSCLPLRIIPHGLEEISVFTIEVFLRQSMAVQLYFFVTAYNHGGIDVIQKE